MDPEQMQQMDGPRPQVGSAPFEAMQKIIARGLRSLQFDNRLGDADGRVKDAMEVRRLRDRTAAQREAENVRETLLSGLPVHFSELEDPIANRRLRETRARRPITAMAGGGMMNKIPSYNTGGQMYQYGHSAELAPYYANLLGQMQQYGAQNMYGSPAQQAALQAQQIYGMGSGPSEFGEAKNILMGDPSEYMSQYTQQVIDPQIRAAQEQAARSMQDLGSGAAGQGAFGGGRHDILKMQGAQNLAQNVGDITRTGYENAYQDAQQRQMAMFGGLAGLGRDREASQMARLGMFNQAATGAANLPYQNLAQQVGLSSQMGYKPSVYQGQGYQPGLFERMLGRGAEYFGSSGFLQNPEGTQPDPTGAGVVPMTGGPEGLSPEAQSAWEQQLGMGTPTGPEWTGG